MLNPKIQEAFNKQINAELFSEYLYLSMAAYFEAEGFKGMAQWMRMQADEERMHALKFYDYIYDRNGRVTLTQIEAPKTQWNSPLDAFEDAYKHEQKVSGLINELSNLALSEKDHMAHQFLEWFAGEQVEEESAALTIVDQLKLVGDHGMALYMIDQQLGQRQPPAAPGAT
ncbi:MAG: ferritin [Pirellulales bacterium]|nr:ferritin [Pirellulales bacterium]